MFGGMTPHQWLHIRKWALESRKDIERKRSAIAAELARIGEIKVRYNRPGGGNATEQRVGIQASGTLLKLCQAYIAHGGNPFDISLFLYPNSAETIEFADPDDLENDHMVSIVPAGGVAFPSSSEKVGSPGALGGGQHMGGNIPLLNYPPNRTYEKTHMVDDATAGVWNMLEYVLRDSKVELRETLQNIEWNIVKLCDLREQLENEVIDMNRAWGGTSEAIGGEGTNRFEHNVFSGAHRVQNMVAYIDSMIFDVDQTGFPDDFIAVEGKIATTPWLTPSIYPDEGMVSFA
jgi:hypothetical protein